MVASREAIERDALFAARDGRSRYLADMMVRQGEVTANDVSHGAQLGDAFCAELLAHSGRLIGESLAPIVNFVNPAVVVLAGALAQSGEILLAAVRQAIYQRSHPLATRDLRIVRRNLRAQPSWSARPVTQSTRFLLPRARCRVRGFLVELKPA